MYIKNFGEFFVDQIKVARTVILSHTDTASTEKVEEALSLIREQNPDAVVVTTPISALSAAQIKEMLDCRTDRLDLLREIEEEVLHHHHHHEDDNECECHHHHDEDDDEDDKECECHHHHDEGDNDDNPECECHHHHDEKGHEHHHHHHDADEVFTSWGRETAHAYTEEEIKNILSAFDNPKNNFGTILRAKGIVAAKEGAWIHFDYIPGEADVRRGAADATGKLCVIGSGINEDKLATLFGVM